MNLQNAVTRQMINTQTSSNQFDLSNQMIKESPNESNNNHNQDRGVHGGSFH